MSVRAAGQRLHAGIAGGHAGPSAAAQFLELWQSGACDAAAHAKLEAILARHELSGRMTHGEGDGFGQGLLSNDKWKRLSWIFGPDAIRGFLGKDARGICMQLGFGEDWLDNKLPRGKRFKLAVFPSKSVDSTLSTWNGVEFLLEKHFPEAWPKVAPHMEQIRATPIEEMQRLAGYDMGRCNAVGRSGGADDVDGESNDENYTSLQRLLKREGTLVQARQFLWDECGIKGLFAGDGRTQDEAGQQGPNEYLARNVRIDAIEGCAIIDVHPTVSHGGTLSYFDGQRRAEVCRTALVIAGAEFVDRRYPLGKGTSGEFEFEADAVSGSFGANRLGRPPVLETAVCGKAVTIGGSGAILHFVCNRYGLMGAGKLQAGRIDCIAGIVGDISNAFEKYLEAGDKEHWFTIESAQGERSLAGYLLSLDGLVDGDGYAVGSTFSMADCVIYQLFGEVNYSEGGSESLVSEPMGSLEKTNAALAKWAPKVAAIVATFGGSTKMQMYLAARHR